MAWGDKSGFDTSGFDIGGGLNTGDFASDFSGVSLGQGVDFGDLTGGNRGFTDPSESWGDFGGYGTSGNFNPYSWSSISSTASGKPIEVSFWDSVKNVLSALGKGVIAVGSAASGAWPVTVIAVGSLIKDMKQTGQSMTQIAEAISGKTGLSADEVATAINSQQIQSASKMNKAQLSSELGGVDENDQRVLSAFDSFVEGIKNDIGRNTNEINTQPIATAATTTTPALTTNTGTPALTTNTGGTMTLEEQLKSLLGTTGAASNTDYFRNAMNEFTSINTDIKFIHDMAELEGVSLSDEEKGFLETMRSNATTNLTNTVNESTIELAQTEIAKLVDRGVLQGNIGSETLAKIYEKAGKIVGEQSRSIESDIANMGFQTLEQKKKNVLDIWGKELTADVANVGAATDKWKSIGTLELGKTEQQQTWNQNLINALTTMRGQDISLEGAKLGANTNLNLASQEMNAWKSAQDKQLWSNIGSVLIDKWL